VTGWLLLFCLLFTFTYVVAFRAELRGSSAQASQTNLRFISASVRVPVCEKYTHSDSVLYAKKLLEFVQSYEIRHGSTVVVLVWEEGRALNIAGHQQLGRMSCPVSFLVGPIDAEPYKAPLMQVIRRTLSVVSIVKSPTNLANSWVCVLGFFKFHCRNWLAEPNIRALILPEVVPRQSESILSRFNSIDGADRLLSSINRIENHNYERSGFEPRLWVFEKLPRAMASKKFVKTLKEILFLVVGIFFVIAALFVLRVLLPDQPSVGRALGVGLLGLFLLFVAQRCLWCFLDLIEVNKLSLRQARPVLDDLHSECIYLNDRNRASYGRISPDHFREHIANKTKSGEFYQGNPIRVDVSTGYSAPKRYIGLTLTRTCLNNGGAQDDPISALRGLQRDHCVFCYPVFCSDEDSLNSVARRHGIARAGLSPLLVQIRNDQRRGNTNKWFSSVDDRWGFSRDLLGNSTVIEINKATNKEDASFYPAYFTNSRGAFSSSLTTLIDPVDVPLAVNGNSDQIVAFSSDYNRSRTQGLRNKSKRNSKEERYMRINAREIAGEESWGDPNTGGSVFPLAWRDIDVSYDRKHWFHLMGGFCIEHLPPFKKWH
jgi:hypothetical protein